MFNVFTVVIELKRCGLKGIQFLSIELDLFLSACPTNWLLGEVTQKSMDSQVMQIIDIATRKT